MNTRTGAIVARIRDMQDRARQRGDASAVANCQTLIDSLAARQDRQETRKPATIECAPWDSEEWAGIEVFPYGLTYNQYGRAQFRRCQFRDCGADAVVIVKRTSRFSGNTYSDAMCEHHAKGWLPQ